MTSAYPSGCKQPCITKGQPHWQRFLQVEHSLLERCATSPGKEDIAERLQAGDSRTPLLLSYDFAACDADSMSCTTATQQSCYAHTLSPHICRMSTTPRKQDGPAPKCSPTIFTALQTGP